MVKGARWEGDEKGEGRAKCRTEENFEEGEGEERRGRGGAWHESEAGIRKE